MSDQLPLILYIHGFNSSPQSQKCQQLGHYISNHNIPCEYQTPVLGQWPGENSKKLYRLASAALQTRPVFIIGSSLGGFYGTWLMERLLKKQSQYPVKLVLVNPAVHPDKLFEDYLGPQKNYHTGEEYELTHEHVKQLKHLEIAKLHRPDQILLLAQSGDETLDYRQAATFYQNCPQRIDEGGNHGFEGFIEAIPIILSFFSPLLIPQASSD